MFKVSTVSLILERVVEIHSTLVPPVRTLCVAVVATARDSSPIMQDDVEVFVDVLTVHT